MQPASSKKYLLPLLIIAFSFFLVNAVFQYVGDHDNKYAAASPPICEGRITLTETWFEHHPITPLTDSWEWCVLSPGASETCESYGKTFIGQYGSFSRGDLNTSPYGQAKYRLALTLPERNEPYLLLLTEVFSACEVRINGQISKILGQITSSDYHPLVKNITINIPPGDVLIEITASNYTHYYSGVTYPPLFGTADAINGLVIRQLLLYSFLCFFTLGAAVISLAFWNTHRKKRLYLLYGMMSLCFAVYISYPLTRFLGIRQIRFFYALEDAAFYCMIFCIVLITQLLCELIHSAFHRAVASICLFFCVLPAVTGFLLAPMLPQWINLSGRLINLYKPAVSIYLIAMAILGLFRQRHNLWLLAGNLIFGLGILTDAVTGGRFEPIRWLWQTEYTSFFIVLIFTAMVMQNYRQMTEENERLTLRLEEEVEKKTGYLTVLLNERRQLLSGIAHDMKAPIAVIKAYIDLIRMGNVQIDKEADEYISIIEKKSSSLAKQLSTLQNFNLQMDHSEAFSTCELSDFLREVREETAPYADSRGIYFRVELHDASHCIRIQRNRLLRAFENIILNATEHTPAGGLITVSVIPDFDEEQVRISIQDTGSGIAAELLPHIFEYRFSGSGSGAAADKDKTDENIGVPGEAGPRGIGLYFARAAVLESGGTLEVRSTPGEGTVFTVILGLYNYMESHIQPL